MKNSLFCLSVLPFCVSAAAIAQPIEYRWVERHGQTSIGPGATVAPDGPTVDGHSATDATILLTLEARVLTGGSARGLSTFAGNLVTNDLYNTGGQFMGQVSTTPSIAPGTTVNFARATAAYAPSLHSYIDGDGAPLPSGRGIFNPFRQIANLGDVANGVLNDEAPAVAGLQPPEFNSVIAMVGSLSQAHYLSNAGNPAGIGLGEFVPLFIVRYDVTSLEPRTLTFTYNGMIASFFLFSNGNPLLASSIEFSSTYSVDIVPAPGSAGVLALAGIAAVRRRRA